MISDDVIAKNREIMILESLKTNNVSKTCNLFGISRTAYYKWLKRYKKYGVEGLLNKKPSKPKMPNETPAYIEEEVLEIVKIHPEYGPQRISYDLDSDGIKLSNTCVYKILKRKGLNKRESRCLYAGGNFKIPLVEKNQSTLCFTMDNIENSYPGFMMLQGTVHIEGLIKKVPVYQITVIDCFSRFAFAKLYNKKSTNNVIDMLETVVLPVFRVLEIDIKAITTNASKEYATNYENSKHRYETFVKKIAINHYILTVEDKKKLLLLNNFNEDIYNKVYRKFIIKEKKSSIEELNNALNDYLTYYNFKKNIHEGPCANKTPVKVLTEYKGEDFPIPTWMYIGIMNN